jgi:hypothetical protein
MPQINGEKARNDMMAAPKESLMKKFLILYHATQPSEEMMAKMTPGQMKAGMELWMSWSKTNASSIAELGAPLGHAKSVKPDSTSDSNTTIRGYSILQADSFNDVKKIIDGHPHFHSGPDSSVEILEVIPMPGM